MQHNVKSITCLAPLRCSTQALHLRFKIVFFWANPCQLLDQLLRGGDMLAVYWISKKRVQRHFGVQAALPGEWAGRFGKLRVGQGAALDDQGDISWRPDYLSWSGGYILAAWLLTFLTIKWLYPGGLTICPNLTEMRKKCLFETPPDTKWCIVWCLEWKEKEW